MKYQLWLKWETLVVLGVLFLLLFPVCLQGAVNETVISGEDRESLSPCARFGWLMGWQYRKNHLLLGVPGADKNYTIKVQVHWGDGVDDGEDVYVSGRCRSDFGDIRFTDNDGRTLLSYWMEEKTDGLMATFWVKIRNSLNINQTIFCYYGKNSAVYAGDGKATFIAFPGDFEYGELKRSYAVVAEDGYVRNISGWRIAEATYFDIRFGALHFTGRYNRTYIVYANVDTDAMITYYDHDLDSFGSSVNLGTSSPMNDPHCLPRLAIDDDGFLYVFWGSHNSNQKMCRSTYPENITAWEQTKIMSGQFTYPQVFFLNGTLYWFHRNQWGGQWVYRTSSDYQTSWTWSAEHVVIDEPGSQVPYPIFLPVSGSSSPEIHVAWNVYDGVLWRDVYYAWSDDGGVTWKKHDGTLLSLPLNQNNADVVYRYNFLHGWVDDVQVTSTGDPVILFFEADDGSVPSVVKIAKYVQGVWVLRMVTDTLVSRYNLPSMRVESDGVIKVFIPIGGDPNGNMPGYYGGEIQEFVSKDSGDSWVKTHDITMGSPYLHAHIMVVLERATYKPVSNEEVQLVWSYGLDEPGSVYAWGSKLWKSTIHEYNIPGTAPGWWAYNQYCILRVVSNGFSGQGAVFAQAGTSGSGYAYHNMKPVTTDNDRVVDVRVKVFSAPEETFYYLTLCDINEAWNAGLVVAFRNDGMIAYLDGYGVWHPLQNYVQGQWYHLQFSALDVTNDTFTLDIDGVTQGVRLGFNTPASELSRIGGRGVSQYPNTVVLTDNYFVRAYVNPEPSHGLWGHEQSYWAIQWYNRF
ncbi:MAG: DUF2341 domain-containing protein [Methanobacteriota archaeon]